MSTGKKSEISEYLNHSAKELVWYLTVIVPDTVGMLAILTAVAAIKYFGAILGVKSAFVDAVHSTAVGISAISLMALLALKVSARIYSEMIKVKSDAYRAKTAAQRESLNADQVAYESVFLRESSILRFQGLRMNKALASPEWTSGLEKLDEVRLLFLGPYSNPTSAIEVAHNQHLSESIDRLRKIKKNCGRLKIRVWYANEFPSTNTMIFDGQLALVRKYDQPSMQRSNEMKVLSERRGSGQQLRELLRSFDEKCLESNEVFL